MKKAYIKNDIHIRKKYLIDGNQPAEEYYTKNKMMEIGKGIKGVKQTGIKESSVKLHFFSLYHHIQTSSLGHPASNAIHNEELSTGFHGFINQNLQHESDTFVQINPKNRNTDPYLRFKLC
jgi:hypothetical protein